MPEEFEAFGTSWLQHHPGWRMVTWNESNLPRLQNQEQFEESLTRSGKSDVARYEILHRHGGVYLDTDFECLRNVESLLAGIDAFAATEDGLFVSCGIIGAVPGHPLMAEMIRAIPESMASHPDDPPNVQTGPKLFTRVVRDLCLGGTPVTIFPPKWFYPYHFSERDRRGEAFPEAYAVHHWAASWSGPISPTPSGPAGGAE
jgi:mannosyltransferase OCH1-like enzyme